jgi:hypothetical protein
VAEAVEISFLCFRRKRDNSDDERPGSLDPGARIRSPAPRGEDEEGVKVTGEDTSVRGISCCSKAGVLDLKVRLLDILAEERAPIQSIFHLYMKESTSL